MQKVYLLLRNNQQTGPYSLEELIQFDLKPFDLIWIEGRSAGWYYPQEIQALHPHLSFLKQAPAPSTPEPVLNPSVNTAEQAAPRKVFVSMPSNASKEKPAPKPYFNAAPGVRHEIPAFTASVPPQKEAEELKTTYAKSLEEVEADYMNWVYQKKTKKKSAVSAKGAVVACLLVGVAFAGWMILRPSADAPVKTPPEQTAFLPEQAALPADTVSDTEAAQQPGKSTVDKKQKQAKSEVADNKAAATQKQEVVKQTEEVVAQNTNLPASNEYEAAPPVVEEKAPVVQEQAPSVTAEAPKEKKKLREKIFDLFRKKPSDKKEEARPVEEEGGERRSVRRETGSNLAQMVTVKFTVPNDWMMGIKGAKATLTNRSSEDIVKATVEVVYYNDDNDILDRKTVTFGSIKSKQAQSVAIPDHATATRLEYNVVSVTGANEPFARR